MFDAFTSSSKKGLALKKTRGSWLDSWCFERSQPHAEGGACYGFSLLKTDGPV